MIADSMQENLSWRGEVAYFRKKLPNGRETWKSLGKLSKDDARRIVRAMIQKFNAEELMEKLELIGKRSSYAKLSAVFAAYDAYSAGVDIDPQTVRSCKNCLRRILRVVNGETFDADNASTSTLTAALLTDYSAAVIRERKAEGEREGWDAERMQDELATAARTIRSTAQQARAVFSAAALQSEPFRKLELPDLQEFLGKKIGDSTIVAYEPPAAAVLQKIRDDVPALKLEDPPAWLALNLMVNGGLRRSSAVEAKWDWFIERGAGVVDLSVRLAKGNTSQIRFDWGLYQEMQALRQDLGEFIVPNGPSRRREVAERLEEPKKREAMLQKVNRESRLRVFDRLVEWLRTRGLDERQPNHELRKWFGDSMYSTHGADVAQDALGHSKQELTKTVYAQRRTQVSLRVI